MITLSKPLRFQDVPQFTREAFYAVDVPWAYLEEHIRHADKEDALNLDPDFQRGHVWSDDKRREFVEFVLRGGNSAKNLYFNCPGFSAGELGDYVLVDGKQRLTAARMFMRDEIKVFGGHVYSDFTDKLRFTGPGFKWHVNDLKTRAEVLQWYLDLNTGGVVHTDDEISKVKAMLKAERCREEI